MRWVPVAACAIGLSAKLPDNGGRVQAIQFGQCRREPGCAARDSVSVEMALSFVESIVSKQRKVSIQVCSGWPYEMTWAVVWWLDRLRMTVDPIRVRQAMPQRS